MKRPLPLWQCMLSLILSPSGNSNSTLLAQGIRNEAGFMTLGPISLYFHYGSYFIVSEMQAAVKMDVA
jgi:hypothetical protein